MRRPSRPLSHKTTSTRKNQKNRSTAKYNRTDIESVRERNDKESSRPSRFGKSNKEPLRGKPRSTSRYNKRDEANSAVDAPSSGSSAPKRVASRQQSLTRTEFSQPVRLNKFLADAGIASRRHADELIAKGVVKVNGKVITELGTKVVPADLITVEGEPVSYNKHLTYIVLNKPKDYITTTNDDQGRKTVMDLIPITQRLYPVGRLDRNTTGCLLITNDGDLSTRLMHPKYQVEREYVVGLDKKLRPAHAMQISQGVELDDGVTGESEIVINPDDHHEVVMLLREGRNREVRRIFEHFDYEVLRLHRRRYATITVSGLSRGEYRHLTREEVRHLRALVGLKNNDNF